MAKVKSCVSFGKLRRFQTFNRKPREFNFRLGGWVEKRKDEIEIYSHAYICKKCIIYWEYVTWSSSLPKGLNIFYRHKVVESETSSYNTWHNPILNRLLVHIAFDTRTLDCKKYTGNKKHMNILRNTLNYKKKSFSTLTFSHSNLGLTFLWDGQCLHWLFLCWERWRRRTFSNRMSNLGLAKDRWLNSNCRVMI